MSFGRLKSREERQLEQRKRKARGRRNLSQLVGPQGQGGRTPMQRGYTSSSVKPPPFQQSNVGNDITQAGLAYKGGKGLFDFTQGKEAYIDEAGNAIKEVKPWTIGGESIGDKLSGYGDTLSGYADKTGEALTGLFSSPNPTATAGSYGPAVGNQIIPGSNSALQAAEYANSPALQTMNKFGLGGPMSGATKLNTQLGSGYSGLGGQSGILGGMGDAVSASSVGSNLPSGGGAFSGSSNIASSGASGANQLATKSLDASTKAAGTDALGAAGSALGVGLNIYDMVDNGVNISNSLGLGGSALLGANALGIGLANSWNPLGWAMLAGSIGSSFF
jgi:hypothetical protein